MTTLATKNRVLFHRDAVIHDDDGNLDAERVENVIRDAFPHLAVVECVPDTEGSWANDLTVKIIERPSFDSPLLHFTVWEDPEEKRAGISRIDGMGRVLTS